jgi:SMI1 / KNR4 family (SUKH-1)
MVTINRFAKPSKNEVDSFFENIMFLFPEGFREFYSEANGAEIFKEDIYIELWPITEMVQLNIDYEVESYVPDFFIFGSDGGDMALAINKKSKKLGQMPFIGMSNESFEELYSSFSEIIE